MRLFLAAAALAASLISVAPMAASAAPAAGSQFAGSLATPVDSHTGYVGEPVRLTNVFSQDNEITGATMYGTVTAVQHASQGRPGRLQMTFTRLRLRSGAQYAVDGVVTGMQAQTKTNALKEVGGAVAGMVVGNVLGKAIFHMAGGGLIGAAGGFLLAKNNRQDVTISRGSGVRVTLRSARRQSGH